MAIFTDTHQHHHQGGTDIFLPFLQTNHRIRPSMYPHRRPVGRYGEDDDDSSQMQAPPSQAKPIVIMKPPAPMSSLDSLVYKGDWEAVLMKITSQTAKSSMKKKKNPVERSEAGQKTSGVQEKKKESSPTQPEATASDGVPALSKGVLLESETFGTDTLLEEGSGRWDHLLESNSVYKDDDHYSHWVIEDEDDARSKWNNRVFVSGDERAHPTDVRHRRRWWRWRWPQRRARQIHP
jgi:hypothetical protein